MRAAAEMLSLLQKGKTVSLEMRVLVLTKLVLGLND